MDDFATTILVAAILVVILTAWVKFYFRSRRFLKHRAGGAAGLAISPFTGDNAPGGFGDSDGHGGCDAGDGGHCGDGH